VMICDERDVPLDEFETTILSELLAAQADFVAQVEGKFGGSISPIRSNRRPGLARLASVAAAVVLVAFGTVVVVGRHATSASATPALPRPLVFSHGRAADAVALLERMAAAQQGAPSSSGRVVYSKTQNYALQVTVSGHRSSSVVETTVRQVWRSPDGSALVREYRQDTEPAGGDLGGPKPLGGLDHSGHYKPGQWADDNAVVPPSAASAVRALQAEVTQALARYGTVDAATDNFTIGNIAALHLESGTATPQQTAAVYDLLATAPGIFYAGTATDSSGRPGEAVGVVLSDSSSIATGTEYFIIDSSGTLLQIEEIDTPNAPPALKLPPGPTVQQYEQVLTSGFVDTVGAVPTNRG
jgi:hypothetical protein